MPSPSPPPPRLRPFAPADYLDTLAGMRAFTAARDDATDDEIWLVEHPPVFTQGLAGRAEHVRDPGGIPVIRTERGGQVTYHGPGQVVAYVLVDLRRRGLTVRDLVCRLEAAGIDACAGWGVAAVRRPGAPGLYRPDADGRPGAKLASLGLKISRGCSFHGIALNVAMDLSPFERIDPCGYAGQPVTDLRRAGAGDSARPADVARRFGETLAAHLQRP